MQINEEDITLVVFDNSDGGLDVDPKLTPHGEECVNAVVELINEGGIERTFQTISMDKAERVNNTVNDIPFNADDTRQNNLEKVAEFSIAAILKYVNGKLDARVIN